MLSRRNLSRFPWEGSNCGALWTLHRWEFLFWTSFLTESQPQHSRDRRFSSDRWANPPACSSPFPPLLVNLFPLSLEESHKLAYYSPQATLPISLHTALCRNKRIHKPITPSPLCGYMGWLQSQKSLSYSWGFPQDFLQPPGATVKATEPLVKYFSLYIAWGLQQFKYCRFIAQFIVWYG